MKKRILLLLFIIQTQFVLAQTPVVSNVSFTQRTDGSLIVDIYYDVSDSDGETKKIKVEASNDNGVTWDLTCTSLTGDVGTGISLGTDKHIVWDFYADNPNESGDQYKVRVSASEVGVMTGNNGTTYATVKIGNQWWMAENLKETQYRNSDGIPEVTDGGTWSGLTTGARCAYNNSESTANTYGYMYNWFAVDDSRNIAPLGWHVATQDDWNDLASYIGGGSVAGGKMKETGTTHWASPNTGATNEYGFTALPGGRRKYFDGTFFSLGYLLYCWSSTSATEESAWSYYLENDRTYLANANFIKQYGYYVRLVKD